MAGMGAQAQRAALPDASVADAEAHLRQLGLAPRTWHSGPGDRYEWHAHPEHKVLYCVEGGIVFHTRTDGEVDLGPGDRLDLPPGTEHAATVGPSGVACVEAFRP